jgi:hypothetical protein
VQEKKELADQQQANWSTQMDDIEGIVGLFFLTISCIGLFFFGFTFAKIWQRVLVVLSGPGLFALGIYIGIVFDTLAVIPYGLLLCVILAVWISATDKS